MKRSFLSKFQPRVEKRLLALCKNNPENDRDINKWNKVAVQFLARRLKRESDVINDLEKAIKQKSSKTKCVLIPKVLDNRLLISHRRALPQVIYCRLWRWPDLQSHHQIRAISTCQSSSECTAAGVQHPLNSEDVCVNPYHYERETPGPIDPILLGSRIPPDLSSSFEDSDQRPGTRARPGTVAIPGPSGFSGTSASRSSIITRETVRALLFPQTHYPDHSQQQIPQPYQYRHAPPTVLTPLLPARVGPSPSQTSLGTAPQGPQVLSSTSRAGTTSLGSQSHQTISTVVPSSSRYSPSSAIATTSSDLDRLTTSYSQRMDPQKMDESSKEESDPIDIKIETDQLIGFDTKSLELRPESYDPETFDFLDRILPDETSSQDILNEPIEMFGQQTIGQEDKTHFHQVSDPTQGTSMSQHQPQMQQLPSQHMPHSPPQQLHYQSQQQSPQQQYHQVPEHQPYQTANHEQYQPQPQQHYQPYHTQEVYYQPQPSQQTTHSHHQILEQQQLQPMTHHHQQQQHSPHHQEHSPLHHRQQSPVHHQQHSPVHHQQHSPHHQQHSPVHHQQHSPMHHQQHSPVHHQQHSPVHHQQHSPIHHQQHSPIHHQQHSPVHHQQHSPVHQQQHSPHHQQHSPHHQQHSPHHQQQHSPVLQQQKQPPPQIQYQYASQQAPKQQMIPQSNLARQHFTTRTEVASPYSFKQARYSEVVRARQGHGSAMVHHHHHHPQQPQMPQHQPTYDPQGYAYHDPSQQQQQQQVLYRQPQYQQALPHQPPPPPQPLQAMTSQQQSMPSTSYAQQQQMHYDQPSTSSVMTYGPLYTSQHGADLQQHQHQQQYQQPEQMQLDFDPNMGIETQASTYYNPMPGTSTGQMADQSMEPVIDIQQVPFQEGQSWCSITYHEFSSRLGEKFQPKSSVVSVDGFTQPLCSDRFCIGGLSNVNRNDLIEWVRRRIGKGVRLTYVDGEVYVESQCVSAIFVSNPMLIEHTLGSKYIEQPTKLSEGCSLKVFSTHQFSKMLSDSVAKGFEAVYKLTNCCIVRISFVKGWGRNYKRQSIFNTPCWVEVQLNGPLQWIDKVLRQMKPPAGITTTSK